MREHRLITDGSFCEGDFIDGLDTISAVKLNAERRESCRFFPNECPATNPNKRSFCIPKAAQEIARYTVKLGTSVDEELKDFAAQAPMPPGGYFDPTRENPLDGTTDRAEIIKRVGVWANKILGIQGSESATLNHEYNAGPDEQLIERYPVLFESVFDEETSTWLHNCGTLITVAEINHPIRHKLMPLAGPGSVQTEHRPYCSKCNEKPSEHGSPVYIEDEDRDEAEILKRMRRKPS